MVLVDTSVWVSHFKHHNDNLNDLLCCDEVLCHPYIIAEIACGTPPGPREQTIADFRLLKSANIATMNEILLFIEQHHIYGRGCGVIDISLLASTIVTDNCLLWTNDKKLSILASEFHVNFNDTIKSSH